MMICQCFVASVCDSSQVSGYRKVQQRRKTCQATTWLMAWVLSSADTTKGSYAVPCDVCVPRQVNVDKVAALDQYKGRCQPMFLFYKVSTPLCSLCCTCVHTHNPHT